MGVHDHTAEKESQALGKLGGLVIDARILLEDRQSMLFGNRRSRAEKGGDILVLACFERSA